MAHTQMPAVNSFLEKGYIPLACNRYAGIGWQGEPLHDFWMWNKQYIEVEGRKRIQTVKAADLKEAAIRYWRDGWVPLKGIDERFLRRMENALRGHRGLKREGISFPDTAFLELPRAIPAEVVGPEAAEYSRRG